MGTHTATWLPPDEQCLSWLLETLGQAFWQWNVQTGELQFAPRWLASLGFDPAEVPADVSFWARYVHPADYERTRDIVQAHLEGRTENASSEYRIKSKAGDWHWMFDRAKVVERAPDGTPVRVIGTSTDITEQKNQEAQVLQVQRLENIGRVAGAVAHDFNNLLTVINGYSEIALAALDERDPLHESIKEIKSAGDRAAALTQHLLAFSRRQVMQAKLLDLNDVLGDCELMLQRLVGDNIQLVLIPDPGVGHVKADPAQLQQVLMNLALNGRDAMPGGGKLIIETSTIQRGDEARHDHVDLAPGSYVLLSVTDTGTGMDEATLSRLFEPFFTTKEKGKGTGLGLSTVYGIIKQTGGHVVASSRVAQGTTFRIYLPRVDAPAPAQPAAHAADAAQKAFATDGPAGTGRQEIDVLPEAAHVLVVDDEAEIRKLLRQFLEHAGFHVTEASNGRQAVREVNAGGVALVITDLVMPEKEGIETIREMRLQHRDVKIIAMSGAFGGRFLRTAEMLGAHATLSKPVRADQLVQTVKEVLGA